MILVLSITTGTAPLRVTPRAELHHEADAAVAIGYAPDGLPLVLSIARARNVRSSVLSALGRISSSDLKPAVADALAKLERVVGQESCADGITRVGGDEGYTTAQPVGRMLGASLLAKALGDLGPLAEHAFDGSEERAAMTSAGVVLSKAEVARMMGSAGATRKLFVPLPDGRCRVVTDGERDARPLVFESLRALPNVRIAYRTADDRWHDTTPDQGKTYRSALAHASAVAWWVPRHTLGIALAGVGHRLEELHARGVVHGDVKPANVLLTEEGPLLIDPLAIPAGQIATVCTPSWAAPEQVTVRPIGPSADVFALGLMLAKLVDAVIFGEERTFVVPVGGNQKRTMRVLASPEVFIDPTAGMKLDDAARNAYARFIARACAFEPSQRPASGGRFAAELSEILQRHPLPQDSDAGWLDLGWLAGSLHRSVGLLGNVGPAWVLSDRRSPHGW